MLTKEYQGWKSLSNRLDELKALWERNYNNYGHLVKQIKLIMHKEEFAVDVLKLPFVISRMK